MQQLMRIRTARASTVTLIALQFASKPIGYVRTLVMAVLFGAGASMDAYNMAVSLIGFFVGTLTSALENAVLPSLVRLQAEGREDAAKNLMATINAILLMFAIAFLTVAGIAPGVLIHFFAPGFDETRLALGKTMMLWLLPFAAATALKTGLDLWANLNERYTLPSLASCLSSPVGLLILIASAPWMGPRAVPFSQSLAVILSATILALVLKNLPLRIYSIPWEPLKQVATDFIPCAAMLGIGTLYTLVDRYFSSLLAVGSVTALTYASQLFSLIVAFGGPPLLVFMVKSSRTAAGRDEIDTAVRMSQASHVALAIALTYFLPFGAFLAACARPCVSLLWGYGAFDSKAVHLTAACFSLFALASPLNLFCTIFYRVAQVRRRLWLAASIGLISVALNALLDFFLYRPLGAPGLAAATSFSWLVASSIYGRSLLGQWGFGLSGRKTLGQCFLALCWALPLWFFAHSLEKLSPLAIPLGFCLGLLHLFLCERMSLYADLPKEWRPREMASYLKSQIGKMFEA